MSHNHQLLKPRLVQKETESINRQSISNKIFDNQYDPIHDTASCMHIASANEGSFAPSIDQDNTEQGQIYCWTSLGFSRRGKSHPFVNGDEQAQAPTALKNWGLRLKLKNEASGFWAGEA